MSFIGVNQWEEMITIRPSHRTDGHAIQMRRDPVCTPEDPNYDRSYRALLIALEKINARSWTAQLAARKRGLPRYSVPEAAQLLSDQIERLARCRITPVEAMASLHDYDVFLATYGKRPS